MSQKLSYYKFTNREHLESLINGKLLFSKLTYFRLLELSDGRGIGDRQEGRAINTLDSAYVDDTETVPKSTMEAIRSFGIQATNSHNLTFNNLTRVEDIDCYIFSCSWGSLNRLMNEFCSVGQPDRYDGVVKIRSVKELGAAIWNTGTYADMSSPGENRGKISDDFHPPMWGFVRYKTNINEVDKFGVSHASPMIKNPYFQSQSEVRIILFPRRSERYDSRSTEATRIFVNFGNQADVISKVPAYRQRVASKPAETIRVPLPDISQLEESLNAFWSKVDHIESAPEFEDFRRGVFRFFLDAALNGLIDDSAQSLITHKPIIEWNPESVAQLRMALMLMRQRFYKLSEYQVSLGIT